MPDDRTRLNALQTGELDVAWVASSYIDEAMNVPDIEVRPGTSLAYVQMQLNRTKSEFEFEDQRVRKALNYAIDRQAILDGVLRGYGETTVQPFQEDFWAHSPEAAEQYEHDLDRAGELLEEAGLGDGFSFELLTPPVDDSDLIGEVIQQQLEPLGIEVSLRAVEPAQTADIFLAQEGGDALVTLTPGQPEPSLATELYVEGFNNPGDHTTEEVQRLHELTITTVNEDEREQYVHDLVHEAVVEEALNVPLVFRATGYLWSEDIVGFEPHRAALHEFRGVGVSVDDDH